MLDKIIIMLTHNDKTVPNAIEIFEENKDLPIQYWGFKDVGMEPEKMKVLCTKMREAGKTSFLEVVSYSEEECMRGAKLAVECGFDYLLGTLYYDSVAEYVKKQGLKYCPFAGKVSKSPSILEGTVEEMLAQEAAFAEKGVFGTDLLGYRYVDHRTLRRVYPQSKNTRRPGRKYRLRGEDGTCKGDESLVFYHGKRTVYKEFCKGRVIQG